jgi:hypothetical protein
MRNGVTSILLLLAIVAITVLVMLSFYKTGDCNCRCERMSQDVLKANKMLKEENQRVLRLIERYQFQKDSLMMLAKRERQIISDLKKNKNEKVQAIDSFSADELLDFFAKLKADTTENRQ